jgi:hypothetical protein
MGLDDLPDAVDLDLWRRLKVSSVGSSQTLLSIIQGVALADLAGVVAASYTRFTLVEWLLVPSTLLVLVAAWNQITMDTLAWVQVPDVSETIIPFGVGVFELYLNHAIRLGIEAWLVGAALMAAASTLGIWLVERRADRHEENAGLLAAMRPYRRLGRRYNIGGMVVFMLLALAGGLGSFAAVDRALGKPGLGETAAVVVASAWILGFVLRHAYYWRKVVSYAQSRAAGVPVRPTQRGL